MKKVKRFLMTLLPSFFVLGMFLPALVNANSGVKQEDPGEDTAIYSPLVRHAQLGRPDLLVGESEDDDGEETDIEVDKVVLHYYNEAGGCWDRAFYLWVTGVDGEEYNLDNAGKDSGDPNPIVTVSDDDKMLTITLDLVNDARFKDFYKKSSLFFIIKFKKEGNNLRWGGQSDDMQLRYAEFPPDTEKKCEVWTMPAAGGGIAILDSEAKTKVHGVKLAKFVDWKTITCELTDDTRGVDWKLYAFDETYFKINTRKRAENQKWYLVKEGHNEGDFEINLPYEAHINMVYSLVSHDPDSDSDVDMKTLDKTVTVGFDKLYNSPKFNKYYEKQDVELGCTFHKAENGQPSSATFRVWSPVSANMTVLIYDTDTSAEYGGADKGTGYHMFYTSGGIWELTITSDDKNEIEGKYYNFRVDNTLGTNVVMDPYATSAGACGVRGYIYDKEKSNPEGWDALPLKWDGDTNLDLDTPQDLTIYEVHMQDFTGDESWISSQTPATKRGTYNAFVEGGTTITVDGKTASTGYDHLKELGVGAVQLVPVFDQDNDETASKYNWGYNPLNYNIVEGAYSSDPHNGMTRVKEFKNLVLQMSKTPAHTRVIMDVVYNHVSSATGSNFHKLMPRYYFRYTSDGELFDGSGCHNEVASERPMMRKFIVDSLCMWAKEYKVKGFRFDLMGLIDFKTMNAVQKALYEIDPDIYIYGEGWSLGYNGPNGDNYGTETWQVYNECNAFKVGDDAVYLGGFNDCFRNAVRGENGWANEGKTYPEAGFIQSPRWYPDGDGHYHQDFDTLNKIADGLWGINHNVNTNGEISGYYPEQTVNYVSCHDNWTLRDQLFQTLGNGPASLESILHASIQAHTLVMASNSAAFILGGEELLRTKEYVGDYADPDAIEGVTITPDSWTELHGHKISHNSYNAPLDVNSFKWGNKIKITCVTNGNTDTITDAQYNYNLKFQQLIQAHKGLLKKRGENQGYSKFVTSTSTGTGVWNRYWSKYGNPSNCLGFQANEAFVYVSCGNIDTVNDCIEIDNAALSTWGDPLVEFGGYSFSSPGYIYFTRTNTVLLYDRHGK